MYTLFYYPNNASLAPHFLLHHMQANYELVLVDKKANGQKSAEYLRLNPAGRIPTLVDGEQPIFESPAICIHLCEQHPSADLMPRLGDPLRPIFFQWLAFLNNTLQAELMVRYYPHRHTTDENSIPSVVEAQDERIGEALSIINDQLAKHDYLIGESLSACDYFLFMLAQWSIPAKRTPMSFPYLAAYLNKLTENPTIQSVCEIEGIDLSPFKIK